MPEEVNILSVTPYSFPEKGGAENYTHNIEKELVKKNFNVTRVCSSILSKEKNYIDGINVIRHLPDFVISNTPVKISLHTILKRLVKNEKYTLITSYMPVPYYADIASVISKKNSIPFILTYHNDLVKDDSFMNLISNIYNNTLCKNTLKNSSSIITPSPYCFNESKILSNYKEKLKWIPPGVDIKKYNLDESNELHEDYNLNYSSKIILFVGQLNRSHTHKGVDILIESFKTVLNEVKNVYLVIVGSSDMIPEYKNLSMNLGIHDNIIFTGYVEESKLIEYYKSSDIVTLPSTNISEGFGMTLIEGNACGKPVIGSNVGGIKYVIKDGETGILVTPKKSDELAKSIIMLLKDEEMAKKMGINGRKLIEEKYTWEKSSKSTIKIFKEFL
ncbi:MAG: glycosyltransferase family 4 protein [Candidatus Methanofastidiosum sp.]|nr:glycosyltransferase family 4 protein [Methanofastidiosum sp.]